MVYFAIVVLTSFIISQSFQSPSEREPISDRNRPQAGYDRLLDHAVGSHRLFNRLVSRAETEGELGGLSPDTLTEIVAMEGSIRQEGLDRIGKLRHIERIKRLHTAFMEQVQQLALVEKPCAVDDPDGIESQGLNPVEWTRFIRARGQAVEGLGFEIVRNDKELVIERKGFRAYLRHAISASDGDLTPERYTSELRIYSDDAKKKTAHYEEGSYMRACEDRSAQRLVDEVLAVIG